LKGEIILFREPKIEDSPELYALIERCKPLDLNARYCYMLLCSHFASTTVLAEKEGKLIGAITAYRDPRTPETLFVWQVAVDASMRGQGIALSMLKALFLRPHLHDISFLETTISPSNAASQKLFARFALEYKTSISSTPYFLKSLFGNEAHEDEELYRVGPLTHNIYKENK